MRGGSAGSSQVVGPTQTPDYRPRVQLHRAGALIDSHALSEQDLTCWTRDFHERLTAQIGEQNQLDRVCETPRHAQAVRRQETEARVRRSIAKDGSQSFAAY